MSVDAMSDDTKVATLGPRLIKSAKDLEVFKRAYKASLDIHRITLEFPKIEQFALADQLRRATKSICANIAEGFAKQRSSIPEFARFLSMAHGSAAETLVWLQYALDLKYITSEQFTTWEDDYIAIASMIHNLKTKL